MDITRGSLHTTLPARLRQDKGWVLLVLGIPFAWFAGRAVVDGGNRLALVTVVTGSLVGVPLLKATLFRRIENGLLAVEVPLLLLLVSNLTLRARSAEDLAYNPLDPAAQFRVACVALAALLGGVALISPQPEMVERRVATPLRLYVLYVAVVFAGAPLSVNPLLTAYRGIELLAGVVVIAGAYRTVGTEATIRIERVLYWFAVLLVASVWLGVVFARDLAVSQFQRDVPINLQISGVFPSISANGVGLLGVMVAAWSLARVASGRMNANLGYAVALIGAGTLVAAQYRTGYVAMLVAVVVWLIIRHRYYVATAALLFSAAVLIALPSLIVEAQPYVLRGQTAAQARQLSSRVDWWQASIPVWERSPWIGRGLLTATRFEVLAPLGLGDTSTIHSTWVEALVGTGIVGVALLATTLSLVLAAAIRHARPPQSWTTPLILLVILVIRSFTGSTIETFAYPAIVFLWLASSVDIPLAVSEVSEEGG